MRQLLEDRALRDRLVTDGRAHAANYTWSACADGYARSFARTLADAR